MALDRVRPRYAFAAKIAGIAAAVSLTGACSVAVPLPALVDHAPTGSISGQPVALWPALDAEDLRRAKAAMGVALDPQGNGELVAWDNPQSGRKGSFAAVAPPYPERDRICRAFRARLNLAARAVQSLEGAACRDTGGDWVVAGVKKRPT